jgi:hypothetical protein
MATATTPVYTGNAAGNIDTSASLAASATRNANWDISANFEGQVHINNTPGGSVSATRGVRVDVYRRYGSSPTTAATPFLTYTMPSTTASTLESLDFFLGTGKYNIKITNLDTAQAVTCEITGDVIANLATA